MNFFPELKKNGKNKKDSEEIMDGFNGLKHLAVTCGGTGGHFNPGLSVAQTLNASGGKALLLLGGPRAEKQIELAAQSGVEAFRIPALPPPKNPLRLPEFFHAVLSGARASRRILKEHRIQALLSMGAYTSLPSFLAAKFAGIPFFLHDGNVRIGNANLLMSPFARALALSFPVVNGAHVHCPCVRTGFPLRSDLLRSSRTREEAMAELSDRFSVPFDPAFPLLLVCGGSLGAETFNLNVAPDPSDPESASLQIVHLAGPGKKSRAEQAYAGLPNKILVLESFEDMALLYTAADFVFARAGGSTVAELAFFGKYALLTPYPFAAGHHQDDNAAWFASASGAEVLADSGFTRKASSAILSRWVRTRGFLAEAGIRNRVLAVPDAAENVLKMIAERL